MSPQDWRNNVVTVGQTPSFPTESSLELLSESADSDAKRRR